MSQQHISEKVSVDVIKKDRQFYADVGLANSRHSLGPVKSRDEIYQLIFNFISDLRLVSELEQKRRHQQQHNKDI